MEITTTEFFANFFGFYMLIMAVLMIFRKDLLNRTIEVIEDRKTSLVCGFIVFFLGLTTIILHNQWFGSLMIIISLIGWLSFIEGILILGWPQLIANLGRKMVSSFYWPGIIISLVVGTYLLFMAGSLDLIIGLF